MARPHLGGDTRFGAAGSHSRTQRILSVVAVVISANPARALADAGTQAPVSSATASIVYREVRSVRVSERCLQLPDHKPGREEGCHLVAFPAVVPSTLPLSYVGIRVGGSYQHASAYPFPSIYDESSIGTGFGAFEFAKELMPKYLALTGSLSGRLMTGLNGGTVLGTGADAGGGVNLGFVASAKIFGSSRVGLVGRISETWGASFLVERALSKVTQNPVSQSVQEAAEPIASAAASIVLPYREIGHRMDMAWLWPIATWFSVQGALGLERRHRVHRNREPSTAPDVTKFIGPRLGTVLQFNLGEHDCGRKCVPISFVLEHELSPTRTRLDTVAPAIPGPALKRRFVEHLLALGVHYAHDQHADFDAGLTAFMRLNAPPDFALSSGTSLSLPRGYEIGAQAMARYAW